MAFNLENKLTNRERFRRLMSGAGPIDRVPALEWASWWDKTITHWEQNGMPSGLDTQELYDYFQLDSIAQFWFPHKTEDCPQDVSHGSGIIETFEDYERIRPYILPENAVELMREQIEQTLPRYQSGETVVWYTIEGFFWWPRVLFGIENHLYAFYDQSELYHRICEDLLQWQIKIIDDFAKYMHADFMTIAEDMSYNLGPMLSEELYNEFMKPYYLRLIPEIKKHGTKVFIDSDGDITKAVPWFVSSGIEGILPLERQA
ncbi:MAG: uroporphyrinogen decarboxylase family protein, partial [Eubacteriales bacterium]|nr:uroporphyrinogen decarboxylase family protein [Eubacteriales bacterium]